MTDRPITGRRILITGGTGSFGNRVASHLVNFNPQRIVIYSRDEKKQWEMAQRWPDFDFIIGDVRDPTRLAEAMRGIDVVFHAAALKQVPSCETYPFEAVLTNTVGSQLVCEAALAAGVETLVALSTDKAVKPVNAMGTSKAMMEKLVCSKNRVKLDTVFCCVRYGNVMGSRGSVIPHFLAMKRTGVLPITVQRTSSASRLKKALPSPRAHAVNASWISFLFSAVLISRSSSARVRFPLS